MRLILNRYAKTGKSILGFIETPGRTILTLEDTEERLDSGFYHMVSFNGTRFRQTWALIGADCSMYPEEGISRSTCILHPGDTHEDTTGCVIVGYNFHFDDSDPNINGGADVLHFLRGTLIPTEDHYIDIREAKWI